MCSLRLHDYERSAISLTHLHIAALLALLQSVMASIVMDSIFMASIVMTYIVMAYVVLGSIV